MGGISVWGSAQSLAITAILLSSIAAALGAPVWSHKAITIIWALTVGSMLVCVVAEKQVSCGQQHQPDSNTTHLSQELHTFATMHATWIDVALASTKHMHVELLPCYGLLLVRCWCKYCIPGWIRLGKPHSTVLEAGIFISVPSHRVAGWVHGPCPLIGGAGGRYDFWRFWLFSIGFVWSFTTVCVTLQT